MVNKKFILNADNFGMSKANNRAVLNGCLGGFLSSASLCANGKAFNAAVNEIIPELPNLSVGVHINLTTGRALTKAPLLTNKRGKFNKNFFSLLFMQKNKKFLEQIEFECRTQIETIMTYTEIDHIDSFMNIHAIPEIFEIIAKLAAEYKIPYIRTHQEELYFVPSIKSYLNYKYINNLIKYIILSQFNKKNKNILKKYNLKTNNYCIGLHYNGLMDEQAIEAGLKEIDETDTLVEAFIQPGYFTTSRKDKNSTEYFITQNKTLEDNIKRLGFEITNYRKETQCHTE